MTSQTNKTAYDQEIDELKTKLIIASLISIPSIIIMNPTLIPGVASRIPAGSYGEGLAWSLIALISVPVYMWCVSHLYIAALNRLKQGSVNLSSLLALAIAAASLYSLAITIMPGFNTIAPTAHPLWDIITVVVSLSLIYKITQVRKEGAALS